MPRKTKEAIENEEIEKPVKKSTSKKTSTKKESVKKVSKKEDKSTSKPVKENKTTKKTSSTKKENKTSKTTTSIKSSTKKTSTRARKTKNKEEIITTLEYYDLPYRYNETLVKILAQTPNTLFVYWDIADDDRKKLEETYGSDFFTNTNPVLIIHNETKNYTFEVEINDFANSWYLHLNDTDCKYNIELGRKFKNIPINIENNIQNNYIYICSSNNIITPNDHILFNYPNQVQFKNVKTNTIFLKEIKNMKFILNKENYNEIYSNNFINEFLRNNPTSNIK